MGGGEPRENARPPFLWEGDEGDDVFAGGGGGDHDDGVSGDSLFSSRSSLTDDDEEGDGEVTSPPEGGRKSRSSSSSESMLLDGGDGDGGPLYELSPLLAHLPVRTGLSKFYQGSSQSFTSLFDAKCVKDLAKKTTPYARRMKASRGYSAARQGSSRTPNPLHGPGPGPCSKGIAKKPPWRSSNGRLSRARSKPPAYKSKRDAYRF